MTLRRDIGTTNELVDIFVQDATVSTGAGFPNLVISTFSSYYHRSDMTSTSSVTLVSTGTLGTWSSGQFLQVNSSFMRGWYQFCCPDGMFATGSSVALHMYGHPSMAPVVMRYDITSSSDVLHVSTIIDQMSSARISSVRNEVSSVLGPVNVSSVWGSGFVTTADGTLGVGRVGVSSFGIRTGVSSFDVPVGVSSFGLRVGVSSIDQRVGVSSMNIGVDVTSFIGSAGVFTAAESSVAFSSVSWSSQSVTVGSVDVSSFYGSGLVTTAAGTLGVGRVGVSSFGLRVGVSSFNSPVGVSSFDQRVGVSSFGLAVGVSSQNAPVDVTSFYASGAITSAAGVLASHVTSMRIAIDEQIADSILARNIAGGSDGGRSVTEAMYFLRNRSEISGTTLTVYQTDDTTSSWEATISTASGNPIVSVDPS